MELQGRWRRIGSVLAVVGLLAIIAPFAVYAVPQLVGAQESFVVLSGSMEPALSAGDVVIVDTGATVEVGDVVTYSAGSGMLTTTHRVVDSTDAGFVTKGDANENADGEVIPPESIVGEVILVIPLIGHVILWANTPVGLVMLVVIPVTALVLSELRRWSTREKGSDTSRTGPEYSDEEEFALDCAHPETEMTEPVDGETIAMIDLKLSLGAMTALFAYAAWNVAREIMAVAAPHPVSVAVMTAGLLGILLAGWITISTWMVNRRERPVSDAPIPTRTDGSGTTEEKQ